MLTELTLFKLKLGVLWSKNKGASQVSSVYHSNVQLKPKQFSRQLTLVANITEVI